LLRHAEAPPEEGKAILEVSVGAGATGAKAAQRRHEGGRLRPRDLQGAIHVARLDAS